VAPVGPACCDGQEVGVHNVELTPGSSACGIFVVPECRRGWLSNGFQEQTPSSQSVPADRTKIPSPGLPSPPPHAVVSTLFQLAMAFPAVQAVGAIVEKTRCTSSTRAKVASLPFTGGATSGAIPAATPVSAMLRVDDRSRTRIRRAPQLHARCNGSSLTIAPTAGRLETPSPAGTMWTRTACGGGLGRPVVTESSSIRRHRLARRSLLLESV